MRYKLDWCYKFYDLNILGCFSEIGSEHGKSVFLLLSKIKAVPSLEAQKDMVKWVLQVGNFFKSIPTFYYISSQNNAHIVHLHLTAYLFSCQMFEIVKCLRDKSSPSASTSIEATKPEEVKLNN